VRTIIQGDALAWLDSTPATPRSSVVTSLPDVSELELDLAGWKEWFVASAEKVVRWVPEGGMAIFFQSDIRFRGAIVDKSSLVFRAAEAASADIVFHKIVCRRPPGTIAYGRPSWSHMIALASGAWEPPRSPGPEVLPDAGFMPWSRAMGVEACREACRYLRENTTTEIVVDPFCGQGTVLAVADAMGFAALGVERSAKRCKAARTLVIELG